MEQIIVKQPSLPIRIYRFYLDGFRQMTLGKTLWKIIFIKLLIIFGVLKLFFFPDFLATNFTTDKDRADYVIDQITQSVQVTNTLEKGDQL
ncbi:DUF4492 domain-containing protein [Desulfogranum marinum]|uniref:DUF4492 domain-containing protein n=1 Tax=Desulfogranum marinum TaxID=453220 RepID=UPI001962CD21|nr:DUF4492 domain-containing protein [Desulfogranum marinum]MBM9511954.1 DUF4492 domain-containing protein [Desulfogranum marinum]